MLRRLQTLVFGVCLASVGCVEFSPFETDLADSERDQTRENLARLQARAPPAGPWKLAAIADSHSHYEELEELVEILNRRGDLELVLHAGDVTDYGLRQEYRWSRERLARLNVPWLTVIGNHDALSNGSRIYEAMFGRFDYTFEWGGVRFVCYNSNQLDFGGNVPNWEFVEEHAVAPDGGGVLLVTHIPPLVPESVDDERMRRLLERPGMLASIHGHLHEPSLRPLGPVPSLVVGSAGELHHLIITVDGSQASIERCRGHSCSPLEDAP